MRRRILKVGSWVLEEGSYGSLNEWLITYFGRESAAFITIMHLPAFNFKQHLT